MRQNTGYRKRAEYKIQDTCRIQNLQDSCKMKNPGYTKQNTGYRIHAEYKIRDTCRIQNSKKFFLCDDTGHKTQKFCLQDTKET